MITYDKNKRKIKEMKVKSGVQRVGEEVRN
jgi:hypothetical protein